MKPSKIHNVRVVATISVGVFLWLAVAQSQTTLPQPTKHVARNFRSVSVEAKSVFISTYNNPNDNSGLAYPEPPVDFNGVKEAIELWPTMTKSERDAVATLKRQVLQWNRYQVVSDPEKADFVMLVHLEETLWISHASRTGLTALSGCEVMIPCTYILPTSILRCSGTQHRLADCTSIMGRLRC